MSAFNARWIWPWVLLCAACAAEKSATPAPVVSPEARLAELGLVLPPVTRPVANYVKVVRSGNLLFVAGHGPGAPLEAHEKGQVPTERSLEEARAAAGKTALAMIATLKDELGDLARVQRIVRVFGMVNASPEFSEHSKVLDGCSELLVNVFGERGRHARAAVGVASLPLDMVVEIEMVVEIRPD